MSELKRTPLWFSAALFLALATGALWAQPPLERWDKNGDGALSAEEFLGPEAAFKSNDANGDGKIDASEMEKMRENWVKRGPGAKTGGKPGGKPKGKPSGKPGPQAGMTRPGKPASAFPKPHPSGFKWTRLLGAKGYADATPEEIKGYKAVWSRMDGDGDGKLLVEEYVERSRHMTPEARRHIFGASDRNQDGIATEREYVENRVITDEAKAILGKMNVDGDANLTRQEFLENAPVKDKTLATEIFAALDTDGNGSLIIPEYLRVWGGWARQRPIIDAAPEKEVKSYEGIFARVDGDKNGELTQQEYITRTRFKDDPAKAKGIFGASDANGDGLVTRSEYVENRIVTEDARKVFTRLDADSDGKVSRAEYAVSNNLETESRRVIERIDSEYGGFDKADRDSNDHLTIPEFFRVWGRCARGLRP